MMGKSSTGTSTIMQVPVGTLHEYTCIWNPYRTFEQDPVGRIEFFSAHIMSLITLITDAEKQPYPLR